MNITALDHLVLTVASIDATVAFYRKLGMQEVTFHGARKALRFGDQKINLHQKGREFEPKAQTPMPGSADLCFIVKTPIEDVIKELQDHDIALLEGPVERTGARSRMVSVYIRDPDANLVELSVPIA